METGEGQRTEDGQKWFQCPVGSHHRPFDLLALVAPSTHQPGNHPVRAVILIQTPQVLVLQGAPVACNQQPGWAKTKMKR